MTRLKNVNSGQYLDFDGNSRKVFQNPHGFTVTQEWQIEQIPSSTLVKFKCAIPTGNMILDVPDGTREPGDQLIVFEDRHTTEQLWQMIPVPNDSSGAFFLQNSFTQQYMDVNGSSLDANAPVIQFTFNGGKNQQWQAE